MAEGSDWREHAACRPGSGASVEWFYPEHATAKSLRHQQPQKMEDQAARLCAGCEVLVACRRYALRHEAWGSWGGLSQDELRLAKLRSEVA